MRNGDDDAFAALYRTVAPRARRTAYRIVQNADIAADLAQEAFCIALEALRTGRGPDGSFTGYVLAITKRLAYRYCALARRTVPLDEAEWEQRPSDTPLPDPAAGAAAALATLPPRWRDVLWLIEVDRYSPAELAAPMQMSPNAVSSLASRARRALRLAYAAAG
ncbi:RNA polymerase sigma factor [Jiangella aurantiaca]|uniref:RNA polymerase sigma factor n=1 Tax=Jiangella aurantiaca TaxID=2530373 RepID=UPI0013A5CDB0|nr:sigma-70 family RNA polymerase sigma factor [Jiangella aurantiaca]